MTILFDLLHEAVRRRPNAPLVCSQEVGTLRYGDIERLVRAQMETLVGLGVERGQVIALGALSDVRLLVCVLAAGGLGCPVVPTETLTHERERLQRLGVRWVLGEDEPADIETPAVVRGFFGAVPSAIGGDVVYVLATSGSTSEPKDVPIPDECLVAFVQHARNTGRIRHDDRVAQLYAPTFDPYFGTVAVALEAGASLIYPTKREALALAQFVEAQSITVLDCVPRQLHVAGLIGQLKPDAMPGLRVLQVGGEAFPPELAVKTLHAAPNADVFNVYGPTEATITALEYLLVREASAITDYLEYGVPLGVALPGIELRLESPNEMPTELLLSGPQLFRGYADSSDDTGRFVDPGSADGSAWYRTGDLVAQSPRGLVFAGRVNAELKVGGRRVDLAIVEAALMAAYGGTAAAVVVEDGRLMALVEIGGAPLSPGSGDVVVAPHVSLPGLRSYAMPRVVATCGTLPTLPNGKRDERRIRQVLRATTP